MLPAFFLILCFAFSHPTVSTKCPSVSPASGEKKKRRAITLEMKLKITAQHEGGKPVAAVAGELGLWQLTILTILKDKKQMSDAVKSSALVKFTVVMKKRAGLTDDMKKKKKLSGNSLVVQWLGLRAFTAEGAGSVPCGGLRSRKPHRAAK